MNAERNGPPIHVGEMTITPIAQIDLHVVRRDRGIYVWGSIEPVAVLIHRGDSEERVEVRPSQSQVTPHPWRY